MNNIAAHRMPVWRPRADCLLHADLAEHNMPGKKEELWARKIDDRKFEICCLPFFTYGIALGDVVEADADSIISKVVTKSGHRNLRAVITNRDRANDLHVLLHKFVDGADLTYEWYGIRYLAVDLSSPQQEEELCDFLNGFVASRDLVQEIDS